VNRLIFLLITLLSFNAAFAQEAGDDRAADRKLLRELGGRYEQAINDGDLRSLAPFVATSASAVFATNHELQGLEAMQKYFESVRERLGANSSYNVKLEPDRTEFFGDMAVAHGHSEEKARLGSGREYNFTTHWTAVLRKEADGWKALRLHVSMDPFDNAVVAARLKTRTWSVAACGIAAAAAALAIGRASKR